RTRGNRQPATAPRPPPVPAVAPALKTVRPWTCGRAPSASRTRAKAPQASATNPARAVFMGPSQEGRGPPPRGARGAGHATACGRGSLSEGAARPSSRGEPTQERQLTQGDHGTRAAAQESPGAVQCRQRAGAAKDVAVPLVSGWERCWGP